VDEEGGGKKFGEIIFPVHICATNEDNNQSTVVVAYKLRLGHVMLLS
jgi:hypothetical protein